MAKRFTRNITDTVLTGKEKEPLYTNVQNDLLSDDNHVYVRNKNDYHCLTNAIQEIESKNDNLIVERIDNKVTLEVIGGGGGEPIPLDLKMESLSKYLDIEKKSDQHFIFSTEQLEIEIANIYKKIEEMGNGGEDDFLGDYNEYDFQPVRNNTFTKEVNYNYGVIEFDFTKDLGLVKARIPSNAPFDFLDFRIEKITEIEHTSKKNLKVDFINMSEKELPLKFKNSTTVKLEPRHENDINYKDGDIKIKPNTITSIKLTFYTDPESKLLRTYVKEIV